jgi:hypothetical protein
MDVVVEHDRSAPNLDEKIYNWIKMGHNTIDELIKLKEDNSIDIISLVEALNRLEDYELVRRTQDTYIINKSMKKLHENL